MSPPCRWLALAAVLAAGCAAQSGSGTSDMGACPATDPSGCGACWTRLSQTMLTTSKSSVDFGGPVLVQRRDR